MRSLDDTIAIQTRARALLMLIVGALAACAVAYWFVQILRGPHYAELAENNQYNEGGITAPRGKVLDRSGRVILCLLYTSPSPRDRTRSRMPSSA